MRNSPAPEVTHGSRRRAHAWGALAALTCPCHLPVPITRRGVSTPARYDAVPRPCPGAVVFPMPPTPGSRVRRFWSSPSVPATNRLACRHPGRLLRKPTASLEAWSRKWPLHPHRNSTAVGVKTTPV
ncbi:hypothetical protein J7E62_28250 [Variovorax paradoxus]|nr:hypothetical protein [Variovorax paradoxus]